MNILYIFPHPDDESFGPAAAIYRQLKQGHNVFLYTLTRGGATRQRFRFGYSVREMGDIRYQEMLKVKETLGLSGLKVDDFPDSGLKELDPRILENACKVHIETISPSVIVSYPVHGISGFHDHLVIHAVIKRVFLQLKDEGAAYLKRLAFITLPDSNEPSLINGEFRFRKSETELIDCVMTLTNDEREILKKALGCYNTYKETIEQTDIVGKIGDKLYFEFFNESFDPPVTNLTDNLNE